jgi:hypothetical protein
MKTKEKLKEKAYETYQKKTTPRWNEYEKFRDVEWRKYIKRIKQIEETGK